MRTLFAVPQNGQCGDDHQGATGTTNAASEDAYKRLTETEKKQRAREKKSAAQRARRKRKLDEEAAGDAAGAAGDAADELEEEEDPIEDPIEDPPARDERRQSDPVPDPSEPGDESDFDEDPIGEASDEDQDEQLTQRCSPERRARSPSSEFSGGDEASWDMHFSPERSLTTSACAALISCFPAFKPFETAAPKGRRTALIPLRAAGSLPLCLLMESKFSLCVSTSLQVSDAPSV